MERTRTIKGEIVHSAYYQNADKYKDKTVLVVGLGESGSDICLQIANVAKSSCVSSRRGPGYVIPRRSMGTVTDLDTNRCYHCIPRWLGGTFLLRGKTILEDFLLKRKNDKDDDLKLLAKVGEFNRKRGLPWQRRFGTKNTAFIEAMLYKNMLYKPDIDHFEENRVVFVDGSSFDCEMVLLCTGFAPRFPFLEEKISKEVCIMRNLYKNTFHPKFGTEIVWTGFARPGIGSIPPVAEMQARYVALIISGERQLPSVEEMNRIIQADSKRIIEQFIDDAPRIGALVDYLTLLNDLANLIECSPPLLKLFLIEPRVWFKVIFGPINGSQFRLVGPGAMPEHARQVMARMPTMPISVLAYEFIVALLCKSLFLLGFKQFQTIGF